MNTSALGAAPELTGDDEGDAVEFAIPARCGMIRSPVLADMMTF